MVLSIRFSGLKLVAAITYQALGRICVVLKSVLLFSGAHVVIKCCPAVNKDAGARALRLIAADKVL